MSQPANSLPLSLFFFWLHLEIVDILGELLSACSCQLPLLPYIVSDNRSKVRIEKIHFIILN